MINLSTVFILLYFFMSPSAYSKNFQLKHGKISVNIPQGWKEAEGLYGIPLSILGPFNGNSRPTIAITATPLKNMKFDESFSESKNEYNEGRERFIQKHKGKIHEFFPNEKVKWKGINKAHIWGYRYEVSGITYVERSYYILCKDKLFHIKSLLRSEHDQYSRLTNEIIRTFRCL